MLNLMDRVFCRVSSLNPTYDWIAFGQGLLSSKVTEWNERSVLKRKDWRYVQKKTWKRCHTMS
jgi:hypothetical protein